MYCPPALILSITSPTVSVAFTSKVKALAPSCAIVKEPAVNPAVSLVRPVTPPVRVIVLNPTRLSKLLVAPSWAVTLIGFSNAFVLTFSLTSPTFFNVGVSPEKSQISVDQPADVNVKGSCHLFASKTVMPPGELVPFTSEPTGLILVSVKELFIVRLFVELISPINDPESLVAVIEDVE